MTPCSGRDYETVAVAGCWIVVCFVGEKKVWKRA